jgi:2-amino-4-hydroxy-6-hydroxymethyldihydropteridine diphosphokinase
MKTVYLSLGSNSGDRDVMLARALERLPSEDIRVVRASAVYETEPRDFSEQPWFLNQIVEIETSLFPRQLLSRLQKIELGLGRVREREQWKGPRTIDIDILFYGNAIVSTPGLEIPHPRLTDRRFVLEPLAELAPEFRHPRTRQTVKELLATVSNQKVHKV